MASIPITPTPTPTIRPTSSQTVSVTGIRPSFNLKTPKVFSTPWSVYTEWPLYLQPYASATSTNRPLKSSSSSDEGIISPQKKAIIVAGVVLPFILMLIFYCWVYHKLRRRHRHMAPAHQIDEEGLRGMDINGIPIGPPLDEQQATLRRFRETLEIQFPAKDITLAIKEVAERKMSNLEENDIAARIYNNFDEKSGMPSNSVQVERQKRLKEIENELLEENCVICQGKIKRDSDQDSIAENPREEEKMLNQKPATYIGYFKYLSLRDPIQSPVRNNRATLQKSASQMSESVAQSTLGNDTGENPQNYVESNLETAPSNGVLVRVLPCDHIFHDACILNWVMQRPVCPMCQLDLT